jgi:hypothetical protein
LGNVGAAAFVKPEDPQKHDPLWALRTRGDPLFHHSIIQAFGF